MLQTLRSGAKSAFLKFILFGLLLLAMGGLALMDVQGMFRTGGRSLNVAEIGREKITTTEFSQMVTAAIRNQGMTEAEAYRAGVPRQLLEQEISTRLFRRAALDLGIVVDDATAARHIRNILTPLVQQGMTEKDALNRILMAFNLSEQRFVDSVKSQIAADQLLQAVSAGARAPRQLIDDALKYRYEWRNGEYFRLVASDAGKAPASSEDDLKAHYAKISGRFALPEYRSFSALVLDRKALGLEGQVSDDILRQHYEDNVADYTTPEMRAVAQIIVKDEGAAKDLLAKARASGDLNSVAASAGKAATFVPATPSSEKDMPGEYASAVFKAQAGDVIGPFGTPLGWHILRVEKIAPPAVKPFDSVKEKIATEISEDKAAEVLYARASEVDDMVAGGSTLAEVAAQMKLTPVEFSKVSADKKDLPDLPAADSVVQAVFSLEKGEATQLIETQDGSAFVIAEVTEVIPPVEEPFEKVKEAVAADLKREQSARLLDEKAAKIVERLQLGEPFDKIAKELGKKIEVTGMLQRSAPSESTAHLPRGLLPSLFALDKTGQSTTVADTGGILILRLAGRKVEVPRNPKEEDVENLTATLNRSLQNDILDQYRQALMTEYDVEINEGTLDTMFRPRTEVE